ncbi:CCR4-Not complex component, Not1-domain-containing protein [Phascolomyces articulosus]|uniref:General negative regulator of transcription subunit 1 n=1 Tax=Phascolomyces articulosus TaxID=60185 RepID=A0AAD5PBP1_9FUNG|nr:CCR4-Not complex component, Not1-domain-containing protein [Phascolomyces articulosus]
MSTKSTVSHSFSSSFTVSHPKNPTTQHSLIRIVKAQVILLASNLTDTNYSKTKAEIKTLIDTYGEVIRQHLLRFLLVHTYKDTSVKLTDTSPILLQLLKEIVSDSNNTHNKQQPEPFITFAETLCAFFKSDSAPLVDLEYLYTQLGLDALLRFVLSSLLLLSEEKQPITDQVKTLASRDFKHVIDELHHLNNPFFNNKLITWCIDAINKCNTAGFGLFNDQDIRSFVTAILKNNKNDPSIYKKIQQLSIGSNMAENDDVDARESVISKKMLEAGYECCSTPDSLRELLANVDQKIEEKDVAVAIGCMARTYTNMNGIGNGSPSGSNWNVENFVTVMNELAPSLNWEKIIECLDYAHFFVYDAKGLDIIVRAWNHSPKGGDPFPANKFFGKWRNLKGQLSALYQMANASTDILSLVSCSERKVIELDDFANSGPHVRTQATQLCNEQLNSLDLFECVLDLSETAVVDDVKVFVEMMVNKSPELVFLGFIQAKAMKTVYQKDILGRLLLIYLNGNASSPLVLRKLWLVNPDFLVKSMMEMYGSDATTLSRILDITHELKLLSRMLDIQPFFFSIDLAALASRREFLNLEKWLQEKIGEHKDVFIHTCLRFLTQKLAAEVSRQEANMAPSTVPLSPEVIGIFLKVLSDSPLSPQNADLLKEVQAVSLKTYPKLMNLRATGSDNGSSAGEISFKPDVEEEANSYYERIYSGSMSIDQMVERLKLFSQSKNAREQDIFACMIHNLFDEYHFFPKYPDKELSITSVLFGALVQHHLVSYVPLGIALRCVLDALRNSIGSKMFNFGVQALTQFQSRLSEWPQYCVHLLQIPQLQQANPELVRFVNSALQTAQLQQGDVPPQDIPGQPSFPPLNANTPMDGAIGGGALASASTPTATLANLPVDHSAFTAISIPEIPTPEDDTPYETPAESIQDKILFIINNIAKNNLEEKTAELIKLLDKTAYQWFSNYLVVKRVSLEPNYHELYLLVMDAVNSRLLYQNVLRETYANIQILLNSEKTVTSSSERSLLKNLGSWLGGLTLARNKPIRHKNIAFKDLLLEGFDSNRLIVIIPFVCKVLEQCNKSVVFKPPNPWLMAILKLMVELYQFAELKLNLRFEIEVLCKGLSLELEDIEPTSILKSGRRKNQMDKNTLMETFGRTATGAPLDMIGKSTDPNAMLQASGLDAGVGLEEQLSLPNIAPYLVFNPQIILYSNQPASKRWVLQAITQSIREIIEPVVERSVAIAAVSTRELIAKDFAVESDENKMRNAAHLMAQNLAGSLAMVTCKEPLRLSMATNLHAIFMANGLTDTMAEQAVLITVSDNLDLVCAVIEKVAMEKVTAEIDDLLMNAYASRKKHREQAPGQAYFDMDIFAMTRYPSSLPEPLRAKPSGLQPAQLRVYEDFARISRTAPQAGMQTPIENERTPQMSRPDAPFSYGYNAAGAGPMSGNANYDAAGTPVQQHQATAHQILERFTQCLAELEKLASHTNVSSFAALPPMHDIRMIIRQVPMLALSSFDKVEAARAFAQKVVSLLYKSETPLAREMYVVLLEQLCEVSPNVGTLVTYWLTHVDDERKYNVPVTVALIKVGLINLAEQDQELGYLISSGRTTAIEFTAMLIHACIFDEQIATPQDFFNSLEALGGLRGTVSDTVLGLLDDIRSTVQHQSKDLSSEEMSTRDQLQYLFAEWVRLYQHPSTTDKAQMAFLTQLSQQNALKNEDMSSLFFRVCIETSIDRVLKYKQIPGQSPGTAYQLIDAFSKLVVGLIKLPTGSPESSNSNTSATKINQFSQVLSVIVLILAQHHEQDKRLFNQRPFLRLFTCLLSDLHSSEQQLQSIYLPILTRLSNMFYKLQPTYFPGFTFAWLQLISHRLFMPKLLLTENQKGWAVFQRLLICLFRFLVPFLRDVELRDTTRMLYRGTLRILLVLLHDFPEFLCDYHFSFCDVIPSSCIQLRNLILSAFPRNMRLPDPFTPNLKVDLLPEIQQPPRILSDYTSPLEASHFKEEIDQFLESPDAKSPPSSSYSVLTGLIKQLELEPSEQQKNDVYNTISNTPSKYNVPKMNALVFHVGVTGATRSIPVHQGAPMKIYQYLLDNLDTEGRYIFLSAIANQLRYPNNHTHYFSCVLLYLFAESDQELVKEQITRVLLERLIVNRPHPWGLLITFIELIKNPRYNFWNHAFTRCATDIERLFESVSRSINQI